MRALLLCFFGLMVATSVYATDDDIVGYVLQSTPAGVGIYVMTPDGLNEGPITVLDGFTIEGEYDAIWDINDRSAIALSPDHETLAFIASQNEDDATLFLFDLDSLAVQQTQVDPTIIQLSSSLLWSPDSKRLFIRPSIIYDVVQDEIVYTFGEYPGSATWMPDSQSILHKDDVTVYQLDLPTITDMTLATIELSDLGIAPSTNVIKPYPYMIGRLIYAAELERIFFTYHELLDPEGARRKVWLASMDLNGHVRLEADLSGRFSDDWRLNVSRLFYHADSNLVYAIVEINETPYRWRVIRLNPGNDVQVLYERSFPTMDSVKLFTSTPVSPDGRYIALAGTAPAGGNGHVVVVDLTNGREMWLYETDDSVCHVYWINETRLITGQANERHCWFFHRDRPSDTLIEHDLVTNTSRMLPNAQGGVQYFFSVFPEIPTYSSASELDG